MTAERGVQPGRNTRPVAATVAAGSVLAPQGCIKLTGPQAVPARSAQKHVWVRGKPECQGAVVTAASRDGSRSDPELDAALLAPFRSVRWFDSFCHHAKLPA
jgi:hypothetical protein